MPSSVGCGTVRAVKFGLFFEIPVARAYKIPHERVMRSIRLLGEHVLPPFR